MSMFPDWLEIRTQPSSLAPTHMTKPYSQNSDPEDKNNFDKKIIFTIIHELHCQCVQKVVKSKCVLNASHVPEEGLCTQKQPGDKKIKTTLIPSTMKLRNSSTSAVHTLCFAALPWAES